MFWSKLTSNQLIVALCYIAARPDVMGFDMLPDLQLRTTRAAICVRASRKWEYRGGTDDCPIQHVDLVLIDAKVGFFFLLGFGSYISLYMLLCL